VADLVTEKRAQSVPGIASITAGSYLSGGSAAAAPALQIPEHSDDPVLDQSLKKLQGLRSG